MDNEMLDYILRDIDFSLQTDIQNVIDDSLEDPHHSAVYTSNLIKCYISVMNQIDYELPYNDVKGYILGSGYDEKDYDVFETSRIKESSYYIGQQF
jgi:hypothetical protein